MLILVAVTINISKDGGLFEKARTAKSGTAYEAEQETLTTYMYGEYYDAVTGKLNLKGLKTKLESDKDKWETISLDDENNPTKLTVVGKQSGQQHIINANGTTGEKKDDNSSDIVGTYYALGDLSFSGSPTLELKNDKSLIMIFHFDEEDGGDDTSTGSYTYEETTKTGNISLSDYGSGGDTFTFNLVNLNKNLVFELIGHNGDYTWIDSIWSKNGYEGLSNLGTETYENESKTKIIEFGISMEDGVQLGTVAIKSNGSILNSMEGYYVCYNNKLIIRNEELTISSDLSTITYDGETYTKQ